MKSDFPRVLSLLRKEKGISQKEAANQLGVSQALLSHYEKGIRECGLDFLIRAADFYGVSADYLLGLTDTKTTNEDVQAVCRVTGLKEDNIYDLMGLPEPQDAPYLREMVNEFLSYAVDECAITTYKAFRKYIDMDNQRWQDLNNLNQEEYDRRTEQMRQFATTASEYGYLIMSYNDAAEGAWKKLHEGYGQYLLSRYRHFDKQGNPVLDIEDALGND